MDFDPYLVDRPLDAERMSRRGGDRPESSRAAVPDEELLTSATTLPGVVGHSAAVCGVEAKSILVYHGEHKGIRMKVEG